jgi:hypothetical protein
MPEINDTKTILEDGCPAGGWDCSESGRRNTFECPINIEASSYIDIAEPDVLPTKIEGELAKW